MKVLIIALQDQIREALEAQLRIRDRAFAVVGQDWLLKAAANPAVELSLPGGIGVVINTLTSESLPADANQSFLEAVSQLAKACRQAAVPLLQLSSSKVFDGAESGRHREDETAIAVSEVGKQLLAMEELIAAGCERHIILRTGPIFSGTGDNLLTQLVSQIKQQSPLQFSKTGKSCPQHAQDVARVLSAIIDQLSCGCDSWGVFHYSSSEPTSHYQFAGVVLPEVLQYIDAGDEGLELVAVDELDTAWRRPLLNCEKILFTYGIKQLPWRAFIVPTVKQLFNQSTIEADNE